MRLRGERVKQLMASQGVEPEALAEATDRPLNAIKNWLATRGSVTGGFIVYQDFFSYRSGVYRHVSGASAGGHGVEIVGHNDAQSCWICKNSWGYRLGRKRLLLHRLWPVSDRHLVWALWDWRGDAEDLDQQPQGQRAVVQ